MSINWKRASSRPSLVVEGVEYDLSNLLANKAEVDAAAAEDELNKKFEFEYDTDENDDDSSTTDYMTCRSRNTKGTANLPGRNWSNASSIFSENVEKTRRESPYRFDLQSMQAMMMSFRGIPELQNSFRLGKRGNVVENTETERDDDPLDLSLPPPSVSPTTCCGEGSSNTTINSYSKEPPPQEFQVQSPYCQQDYEDVCQHQQHHSAQIFSDAHEPPTPSADVQDFYYNESDFESPPQQQPQQQQQPQPQPQEERKTLEEIAAGAAMKGYNTDTDDDDEVDDDDNHEMEIAPGVYVPFRGAKETWQAVDRNTTVETTCFECCLTLICVNNCEYVVCPDCRVVNPIFHEGPAGNSYGVGMGFKHEWVEKKKQSKRAQLEKKRLRQLEEQEQLERQQQQQQQQQQKRQPEPRPSLPSRGLRPSSSRTDQFANGGSHGEEPQVQSQSPHEMMHKSRSSRRRLAKIGTGYSNTDLG